MELLKSMDISASGLQAQRVMVNVISTNLANVHTTRTPEGGLTAGDRQFFPRPHSPRNFRISCLSGWGSSRQVSRPKWSMIPVGREK